MLEDRLSPDETSEDNQQLIAVLQRVHDSRTADAQSRARIRGRLLKDHIDAIPSVEHTSQPTPEMETRSRRAKETNVKFMRSLYEGKTRYQRLSVLAAAVLAAVLVGSLVLLIRGYGASMGNGGFQLRQGWTQIAIFGGTGSKTITGLDVEPAAVWGYSETCTGSGNLDIKMNGVQKNGEATFINDGEDPCQLTSSTRLAPQTISFEISLVKLQSIKVTAPASLAWHLQIVQQVRQSTLVLGSYWIPAAGFGANGGGSNGGNILPLTKPNGQGVHPKTWGIVFVCIGQGSGYIQFTPDVGRINMPGCDGQPRFVVLRFPTATDVQFVEAYMSGDIVWYAQLLGCADEQQCSKLPAINVTPAPITTPGSAGP